MTDEAEVATLGSQLSSGYGALQGAAYDEMWSKEAGQTLEHWRPLIRSLEAVGDKELQRRHMEAQRLLRENGVNYNVYHDADEFSQTWQLDTVPLLVPQKDWDQREQALAQRATLFNLILQDLYGERRLVKEGLIPAKLLYSNKHFLRPCYNLPQEASALTFYSCDLSRGPNGQMWVLSDRTQTPSGAGYALENRIVMTRLFPDTFREIQVHRLSLFFRTVRESLSKLTPNREDPRIVVLTPGPDSETYFEHAYLASYLGYHLVQGNDLAVKDGKVWLKSLEGLKQVDIIFRRLDDSDCDPLELSESSKLGIPGLLQAVREKQVVIANPLGSGVLESPGLLPFLPAIAKSLLGEELKIPSVATWWCGQEKELQYVLDNLPKLVIKSISERHSGVFCQALDKAQLDELRSRIKRNPHLYVGQEHLHFSTAPTLIDNVLKPRLSVMRSFLVATETGYAAMPGGLTRVARKADSFLVSDAQGGISKDTWILNDAPDKQLRVWPQIVHTGQFDNEEEEVLPSRAAENLYWVGRYIERSESTARLLRTVIANLNDTDDYGDDSDKACLHILLQALTTMTGTVPGFLGDKSTLLNQPFDELKSLILDSKRMGGLAQVLNSFVRSAFSVRDLWSNDTWRTIDDIDEEFNQSQAEPINLYSLHSRLDEAVSYIMAFIGLAGESMSHDNSWHLLDIGRRIERVLMQLKLLRFCLTETQDKVVEHLLLESLLNTQESLITHRRRYRKSQSIETALELLLLDPTNPRSLAFQVFRIEQFVNGLPRSNKKQHLDEEQRLCLLATTRVRVARASDLIAVNGSERTELKLFLDEIEQTITALAKSLHHTYFSHTQSAQQLTTIRLEIAP
ncbi:circularly permuted type 2 ATP-grasp protein [Dasania sp. GY-MA-18]|uniref:Circularly permuted type 2 ATP-grasp protein n=1 Tax=Dasania phycosphaerae TaxID=2950436 RepID=A0A9J6RMA4_9GAMM|nr:MULTISPECIES: circularly permuted type 2 ATP-grasp protein [Dasania]MCR8923421.1 circularly permuted type 2 ATP-grasp protein [Dasania sp. GY-MA-18]MCZ0865854.1 circularly permuted type 2 ATP-grasp protein [Dasania phycosphaerae]MCZ0869578.1 circularly permuted type 2 ATP-grasp protein [Dasania phycosphaerae]